MEKLVMDEQIKSHIDDKFIELEKSIITLINEKFLQAERYNMSHFSDLKSNCSRELQEWIDAHVKEKLLYDIKKIIPNVLKEVEELRDAKSDIKKFMVWLEKCPINSFSGFDD